MQAGDRKFVTEIFRLSEKGIINNPANLTTTFNV